MIYLFHGSDANKVRAKAFQWILAARVKAPDAVYMRIEASEMTPESLFNALSAQGLFFSKTLVLLDDPFSETESGELVLEMLRLLAASDNPVAILAPKLLAARLKKIEPHTAKVFEINVAEKKPTRGFNSSLVNALGAKDGATLWKEIVKAQRLGDVPEMIHGLLHWKARDMMQKGSARWSAPEVRQLSRRLIELVSESRNGNLELLMALERFALSLSGS
jgi:DNA polymerase III delta subunit